MSFNNNYGGYLQAYALLSYLKELGHDVELINVQPESNDSKYFIKSFLKKYLLTYFCKKYNVYEVLVYFIYIILKILPLWYT